METIVFVGAGSMAEAIIAGIVEQGAVEPRNVFVMNKSDDERLISLQNKYGVSIVCKEKRGAEKCGSRRSCDETKRYPPGDGGYSSLFDR